MYDFITCKTGLCSLWNQPQGFSALDHVVHMSAEFSSNF